MLGVVTTSVAFSFVKDFQPVTPDQRHGLISNLEYTRTTPLIQDSIKSLTIIQQGSATREAWDAAHLISVSWTQDHPEFLSVWAKPAKSTTQAQRVQGPLEQRT